MYLCCWFVTKECSFQLVLLRDDEVKKKKKYIEQVNYRRTAQQIDRILTNANRMYRYIPSTRDCQIVKKYRHLFNHKLNHFVATKRCFLSFPLFKIHTSSSVQKTLKYLTHFLLIFVHNKNFYVFLLSAPIKN